MFKSKLKIFGVLLIVCLAVCAFSGCLFNVDYEEVYNDDAKIAGVTSNVRIGSVETSVPGSYKFSCSEISGVYTMVKSFTVNENTSAILSLEVTEGKCKVVLVSGKDVYTLTEGSYNGFVNFDCPDGKYSLKIVAVKACINLTLTY